jgi:hypothetical protein
MSASLPPTIEHPDLPEPDYPLLHDRIYSVRSYRKSPTELLLRGQVQDRKPAGLYVPTDPDPLTVHHMILDLVVRFPGLEIVDAELVMETHPHAGCPSIVDHYKKLIGLSIARGFSRQLRELFGGPRGCTHTTALLQAMAPVAIQSMWSMLVGRDGDEGTPVGIDTPSADPAAEREERRQRLAFNVNTCHVWQEDGEVLNGALEGEMEVPLWMQQRLEELGLDPSIWQERMRG